MYCSSCGEELPTDAKFCDHCGTKVGSEGETPEEPPSNSGEEAVDDSTRTEPVNRGGGSTTGDTRNGGSVTRDTRDGGSTRRETETHGSETAGGLEPNVAGALSYLLGFITGLIFYLVEEDDEFVRFHAAQSMVVFGGLFVLGIVLNVFIGFLGAMGGLFSGLFGLFFSLFWTLLSLGALVLWIFLMVKAYQGETPRIPIAADIADDLV